MNNLHFRAWLKDEEKMCEVINIYSLDNCTEVTCQSIGGEENDYADYRLDEVILMQGIEIKGKVIYEGDIVEVKSLIDANYKDRAVIEDIIELNYLRGYDDIQVIGNVYENGDLI